MRFAEDMRVGKKVHLLCLFGQLLRDISFASSQQIWRNQIPQHHCALEGC